MAQTVPTLLLMALAATVVSTAHGNTVISKTFQQEISHDPSVPSPGKFTQRYFLSGPVQDMKHGSPLILYCGPETATGAWAAQEGTFEPTTWAIEAGGLMVAIEHRYFGDSLPFGPDSYYDGNLKYLTVENALADYIAILEHVLGESKTGPHPVLAFGGSYGGLLSAAIRLHYPHYINASLASAAPVYQFGEVANSTWFDEVSETLLSFKAGNAQADDTNCGEAVQAEFAQVWKVRATPEAWPALQKRFGLCDSITSVPDMYSLLFWAKEAFSEVVQFSYPRAQPPCDVGNAINVVCGASVTDRMQLATSLIYNFTEPFGAPVQCFKVPGISSSSSPSSPSSATTAPASLGPEYEMPSILGAAFNTPPRPPLPPAAARHLATRGGRRLSNLTIETIPWDYLCCTEIVMPVAGTGIFSVPAPYDLSAIAARCNATYGVMPDPTWYKTFVSKPLNNATNIIFSNGGYDPVRGFAPATNLGPTLVALDIPAMAHTFDLFATKPGDPPQVVKARTKEYNLMLQMLRL